MKWLFRIIGVVLCLGVLLLAAVLIPAHIQVRGVTYSLPSKDDLLALRSDRAPSDVRYVLTSSQSLSRGQIAHISILVEWDNGDMFMIDTGMDEAEAVDFAELLKKIDSSAGRVQVYGSVSALLGANINKVAGVGFTHLHIDHTQGLKNFCRARGDGAVVLQSQSQATLHNFNTTEGAEIVGGSCLEPLDFTSAVGGELLISNRFPGVAAFELGGHTPGSTLWAVALGEKVLLFSGDTTNDIDSIEHNKPKPALYSYVIVPESTKRTAELRSWLRELDQNPNFSVIVSHDLVNTQSHLREFVSK